MIDICDFAVGLSRQLYGNTIASERPGPPDDGARGTLWGRSASSRAFNFPVAVWSWNAALAAVCGDTVVWKPSERTPLAIADDLAPGSRCARTASATRPLEGLFELVLGGPRRSPPRKPAEATT